MADTQVVDWNAFEVDDEISEKDQAGSNSLSLDYFVGKALCMVVESNAIEKTFKDGDGVKRDCYAVRLKLEIEKVIQVDQPILDKEGKQIERNGIAVTKVLPVPEGQQEKYDETFAGRALFDEINLFSKYEKDNTKKRRLFVAKKIGIIDEKATNLPSKLWADCVGRRVIVNSEWNRWEDSLTGELKENAKVSYFKGYESAGEDAVAETESFDI